MYDAVTLIVSFILLGLLCIALIALAVIAIIINDKHKRRLEELTRYEINVNSSIGAAIPQLLASFIDECFNDYKIMVLVPRNETYINTEREAEIRNEFSLIVSSRLSGALLDKISLFYNIDNIGKILADKIYITVMNYVVEFNKTIDR